MENMSERRMDVCPFCGGTEIIEGIQDGYAALASRERTISAITLYHAICRNCGSVVRSYVADPERMLPKSERRPK